nr:hypothetical protein BaRGS_011104 [Batillaria attramentaria]
MMVLSQLQFRKYLDDQVDPITAAATRLLPRPATLGKPDGDFDMLIRTSVNVWEQQIPLPLWPAVFVPTVVISGTGKTITLYLKALQWRQRGKDVHLLSSHDESRAVIILLEQQLLHAPGGALPEDCERCADDVTHILVEELRVGQSGHDLQYRDTIILCVAPRDDRPVVSRLRARGVPVQVVTSRDDEAAIRNVALSTV